MKELSLHILDIVENSIRAKATQIHLAIKINTREDTMSIIIKDNGLGMCNKLLESVKNPFSTSRSRRKVGLGIPLLDQACKRCGGNLYINSKVNKGTLVEGIFKYNHIDRQPMGDLVNTITMLILSEPEIRYIFTYSVDERTFSLDTREVKEILEDIPINDLMVINWLKTYILENLKSIKISDKNIISC